VKPEYVVTLRPYVPQSQEEAVELYYRRRRAIDILVARAREEHIRANASTAIIPPIPDPVSFSDDETGSSTNGS
jgi:hypothetical protein